MRTITLEEHFATPGFLDGPGRDLMEQARQIGGRADQLYAESWFRETRFEALLMNLGFGPDEGLCSFVVGGDESVDVGLELINGVERCAVEGFACED